MAIQPRTSHGYGWLRPAIGVVELSQNFIQVIFPARVQPPFPLFLSSLSLTYWRSYDCFMPSLIPQI